ncbi:MAG: hypothetical protein WA672_00630 [Candidatus Angelobacter sp.]
MAQPLNDITAKAQNYPAFLSIQRRKLSAVDGRTKVFFLVAAFILILMAAVYTVGYSTELGFTTPDATFGVLVLLLACQALYLTVDALKSWMSRPEKRIIVFVLYSNYLWSLVPALAAVITGKVEVFTFGYGIETWNFGLFLETVFFFIFIIVWKLIPAPRQSKPHIANITDPVIAFIILVAVAGAILYFALTGPWTGSGYEAAGDYVNSSLASEQVTKGGLQMTMYRSVILPSLCILLFYLPKTYLSKWLRVTAGIILVYAAVDSFASFSRGAILFLAFIIGTCLIASGRAKVGLIWVALGISITAIVSPILVPLREGMASTYKGTPVLEKSIAVLQSRESGDVGHGIASWLTNYTIRLDTIQDGGILAACTERASNYAGITPYVGSLFGFMPRVLWPDKPLPLSSDGTVGMTPWYLVMAYRGEPWNNASVSTSGVAFWQFGWLGVVISAILGAVCALWLGRFAFLQGPFGLLLFLSYCAATHMRIPVAPDEFLLVATQVWLPICVGYGIFKLFLLPSVRKEIRL